MELLHINWNDTNTYNSWVPNTYRDYVAKCESVGWLVCEDDDSVILTSLICKADINMRQVIPKGSITRRTVLETS